MLYYISELNSLVRFDVMLFDMRFLYRFMFLKYKLCIASLISYVLVQCLNFVWHLNCYMHFGKTYIFCSFVIPLFTTPSIYNLRNSFEQGQCEKQDFI
jgi:hypothetical protein